jgi:hypothetical protein
MPLTQPTVYPNGYQAADFGYLAMNWDPAAAANTSTPLNANGTIHVARLAIRRRMLITNIVLQVFTAGATLTANQNGAALYNSAGTLLSNTAMTQSVGWVTTGTKVMALGTPQDCLPGYYDVAFFANGTTRPAFLRTGADGLANLGLTTTALRIATADTARTTTFPATLATKVITNAVAWWAGVS